MIKINQKKAYNTLLPALEMLGSLDLNSLENTMKVYEAKKIVKDKLQFYLDSVKELIKKYVEHYNDRPKINEDKSYVFSKRQHETDYINKKKELDDFEIELDLPTLKLTDLFKAKGLTANLIEALEGFIIHPKKKKKENA